MADPADLLTSPTLLGRLARSPADQAAWAEFVRRYGPLIHGWCRRWGLQETDAQDVAQNVLLELARQMAGFNYDPAGSFRGWLRTVARRAWGRYVEARRRPGLGTGDSAVAGVLESVEAGDDLVGRFEEESTRELLQSAMERVQLRVQPKTWEVFRLLALEGMSGGEVAQRLGMKVGAAYVAKSKIIKMIEQEARRLDGGDA